MLGIGRKNKIAKDKPKKKAQPLPRAPPPTTKPTKAEEKADLRPAFRWGIFDEAGYVNPVNESVSQREFERLKIPDGTKAFLFPTAREFIPVYLRAPEGKRLLPQYSRDGTWLCAEKLYASFEKNASFSGKVNEFFHRVGEIKESMKGDFSLKGNLFIVLMVLFGGLALSYGVSKALWFP